MPTTSFLEGPLQVSPGTFEKWTFIFCPFWASDAISFRGIL